MLIVADAHSCTCCATATDAVQQLRERAKFVVAIAAAALDVVPALACVRRVRVEATAVAFTASVGEQQRKVWARTYSQPLRFPDYQSPHLLCMTLTSVRDGTTVSR